MPLPLLSSALAPLLFHADTKRRAEPGGSTLGECYRVQYYQYQDAETLARDAVQPGAVLAVFYQRLIEKRAGYAAVAHDPSQAAMLASEIEAITAIIALVEALEGDETDVVYLPVPKRALAERVSVMV